ncbi:cobalamin-dependent protein [Pelagibius sp. 7325]|uniref:B12-binding domain-containing radical SAM protein n=1 Tax=Pelagibius sp. 7325 TaxID=3131994 RepID=UPI0030EE02B2
MNAESPIVENASPSAPSDLRIWLADLTYTQQTVAADVIPNAVAGIATFTETQVPLRHQIRLFKYPEKLAQALNGEDMPDIIGFSNYVWNKDLSYEIAKVIKKHSPDTVVVFGGPNYPTSESEQERFLRAHPVVDFYIIKEGELAFARLVEALIEQDGDVEAVKSRQIPSVHAVSQDGTAYLTPTIERLTDLTVIPSPYTTGRLDEFFDGRLLPIVQTNRGCPFTCTFCVEGVGYYNKVRRNATEKVSAELDYIGAQMQALRAQGGRNDLFIADSNFGMYREDLDTARTLAKTRERYGWPEYINVATGKNQKERVLEASRIIDGALRLSGSVQSLDPGVLENVKRKNIDVDGLFALGLAAEEVGANTYSEIILALPGDSLEAHMGTVRTVMNANFTNIFLFQLMLLPGTEMATDVSKKQYGMDTRYRVLPRCYGHYEVLGERIVAAEIEEICVANTTLGFDDYLFARRFHLVVTIFYNDGIFSALLKLLRGLDVPVYDWMEALVRAEPADDLRPLFDSFLTETREELWDNHEQLSAFVHEPGIVEKFIAGELGNNLLFVHKTLGITQYLDSLADLARSTLRKVLADHGHGDADTLRFVDDALTYHLLRARNLFRDMDTAPEADLSFDVDAFLRNRAAGVADVKLDTPNRFRFVLDQTQRALVDRYIGIYGDSTVAIGRILSKVHVKKLFRHAVPADDAVDALAGARGEAEFHLSGLQQ